MFHLFRFMPQIAQTSLSNIACQVLQLSRYQWKLPLSPAQHLCQQGIHVLANSRFFMFFFAPTRHSRSKWALACRSAPLACRSAPIQWSLWVLLPTPIRATPWQVRPPCLYYSSNEVWTSASTNQNIFDSACAQLFFGRCVWCNVLPDWIWRVWKKLAVEFQALSAGAPQVVYSSSPYMMPAETIGTMPMTSYTTEMPLAYSSWPQKRQKVNWCEPFWRLKRNTLNTLVLVSMWLFCLYDLLASDFRCVSVEWPQCVSSKTSNNGWASKVFCSA